MITLMKCPFCGAEAQLECLEKEEISRFRVRCRNPLCGCATQYSYNREWIARVWNLRSSEENPYPNLQMVEKLTLREVK